MRWSRPIDYHGSRSYEPEEPAAKQSGPGRFMEWLKGLFRESEPRPSATILLHDGERQFSLLGASNRRKPRRGSEDCPFPTSPRNTSFASHLRHED